MQVLDSKRIPGGAARFQIESSPPTGRARTALGAGGKAGKKFLTAEWISDRIIVVHPA
jgi:hypothetical protein